MPEARRWRHSLKHKVILGTLAIFIVSIWALSYFASRMLREDVERLLTDQQLSAASFAASEVEHELEDRLDALWQVAITIDAALLSRPSDLQKLLEQRPVLYSRFNAGIFALSREGIAIADVSPVAGRVGTRYADYDAIHAALEKGKNAVGQVKIGRRLPQPLFTLAVPIRDADGKVIGALAGTTDLSKLNFLDEVSEHRYGISGGYQIVAPQQRLFVTATDKHLTAQPLPAPGVDHMFDQYLRGFEGSGISKASRDGVEMLTSAKGVPVSGWLVIATLPTEEAFAPIRNLQRNILLAAAFLTLLAGVLSWRLLDRQLSPLLVAAETLAEMADANKPLQALPIARADEIGELIGGFNRLLETLGRSEQRYRSLVTTMNEGVTMQQADGAIVACNPAAERILGLSADQLMGRTSVDPRWYALRENGGDLPGNEHPAMITLRTGQPQRNVVMGIHRPSASRVWILVNTDPLFAEGGTRPYAVVSSFADITEQRQANLALRSLNETLEQRVHEETARNMAQERMLTQQSRLAAMGEMIGNIAHQWRQPINALTLLLTNIKDAYEYNELDKKYLDTEVGKGQQIIQRMSATIDDFRNFFRPNKEKVDFIVCNSVENTVQMVRHSFQNNDIEIVTARGIEPSHAFGYPNEFSQVILNILTNAKDAILERGAPGKVEIRIEKDAEYATVFVRNDGGNIPEETLDKVFDPYFTTKESGTGIGLYMSKMIMRNMNGELTLRNVEGGVEVAIRVPLATPNTSITMREKDG